MLRVNVGRGMDETFKINDKMAAFAEWLIKVSNNFARLDESGKKVILSIGLFLAVVGPLLIALGAIARILSFAVLGFNLLVKPIVLLVNFLPKIIAGFRLLGIVMAANPLGAFIAATATVIIYWKEIIELFKKAGKFVGKFIPSFSEIKESQKNIDYSPTDYKPLFSAVGSGINNMVGSFNNFLAQRDLLPDSFLSGGVNSSPLTNQRTVNNSLTVNIPSGMGAGDATSIKSAIKQALQEENRQTYIELGAQ